MPKIIRKLTEKEVRNARPKSKPYKMCDEGGLRLLIRPSGTKVWQYPYKFHGKTNTYTIGRFCPDGRAGAISMAEARKKRDEIKEIIHQGINPNKHKKSQRFDTEEKAQTTFEAIAREWHSKGVWVPAFSKRILSSLEKDVFPSIGYKQIEQVTTKDIINVVKAVEERGALDIAKRICQRCEAVFDYALNLDLCSNNPASGRSKFVKPHKVKHRPHLSETQLPEFLYRLDQFHGRDYIRYAMNLQILTFVRPGELRMGLWHEVDFTNAVWRIPAERMKMKRAHIPAFAVKLSQRSL